MKFGILGSAGYIAKQHKHAIEEIGGKIVVEYDPLLTTTLQTPETFFNHDFDYCVICSPTFTHYNYTKLALEKGRKVICEKPAVLPWEPLIDNDNINVVLQYKWLSFAIGAKKIKVVVVRDDDYFRSWKGNPKLTGGLFYNVFIHYIQLAIDLKATFTGKLVKEGKQERMIDKFDLTKVDMNDLYTKMYQDIVYNNKGVKPKDLFYLDWVLKNCNWKFGMGKNLFNIPIKFDPLNLEFTYGR